MRHPLARRRLCYLNALRNHPHRAHGWARIWGGAVGELSPKGTWVVGQDQDDVIVMPITTAKKKVIGKRQNNINTVNRISVQALPGQTSLAVTQIESLLRQRHRLQANQDDDFEVR